MLHVGFKHRQKIGKKALMRLVKSGAYKIRMADGTEVTDWIEIDSKFEVCRDPDSGKIISRPRHPLVAGWTTRQLEHVGDAIFHVAARLLCHEIWGDHQMLYFRWVDRFARNDVMGGTCEEVRVGRIFIGKGYEQALAAATNTLKETDHYLNMIRFKAESKQWKT
jgi:hypothetical protein